MYLPIKKAHIMHKEENTTRHAVLRNESVIELYDVNTLNSVSFSALFYSAHATTICQ